MLLGSGERIFERLDGLSDSYEVAEYIPSKTVAHVRIVKKAKWWESAPDGQEKAARALGGSGVDFWVAECIKQQRPAEHDHLC